MSLEKKVNIQQIYKKYLDGSASKEEFNAYLDGVVDPDEAQEMRHLIDQAWKMQYAEKKPPKVFSHDHKSEIVRNAMVNAQIEGMKGISPVSPKDNHNRYRVAAMITILLAVTTAFLMYQFQLLDRWGGDSTANLEVIETVPKEKSRFLLPDGSFVHLNSASKLTFPKAFDGNQREVTLEGEAFFEVARNEDKPFIVRSGDLVTTVLGTSFNINAYQQENNIRVAVVSGKVSVAKANNTVAEPYMLTSNKVAIYNSGDKDIKVESFDTKDMIVWKKDILKFNRVPLSQVATTLERWYGVEVILENAQLGDCLIYGEFNNVSIRQVLETLEYAFNIDFEISGESVRMGGPGC